MMKRLIVLMSILLIPAFSENVSDNVNETFNGTFNDSVSEPWHSGIADKVFEGDNTVIIYALLGWHWFISLAKIAFKFIKVAIIVLLIILLLRFIF